MDDMRENERKVVEELRRRTINDVTLKMLEDISLFYRFAKARDFNITEAETMLRKNIAWRKEMGIDTILTDYEPPEVLAKYAPTSFICFDKFGCIVRLHDCGRADVKGLWSVATKAEWAKFCAYVIEQDTQRVIKRGGNFGKPLYTGIDDFENLTYANAISIKTLQFLLCLLKVFTDNYPEVLRTEIIINAPVYFTWVFAELKPILSNAIIEKVRIYGKDSWKEDLLKEIDADELPAYLGGNRTDPNGNPLCETFITRGQPIPKRYYKQNRTKRLYLESDVEKITVMPFSKEDITFEVKEENSFLEWEFETKARDIDFSLVFRGESPEDSDFVVLIPKQRIDTSDEPEKGCFKCEKLGNYTITFSNCYSWFHSKEVYYRVRITDAKSNEIYNSI
ncbi:retinal-binding protein-like [Argiope bruennichi]|uniref:retinal-binding protein-like n=1 Tax=Argiope bruennichi TaxID=94029 RepID=UPI00249471E3|nr:retinal-binding protein-like [Argiope bruennichi]